MCGGKEQSASRTVYSQVPKLHGHSIAREARATDTNKNIVTSVTQIWFFCLLFLKIMIGKFTPSGQHREKIAKFYGFYVIKVSTWTLFYCDVTKLFMQFSNKKLEIFLEWPQCHFLYGSVIACLHVLAYIEMNHYIYFNKFEVSLLSFFIQLANPYFQKFTVASV